jgi:hypothetical protein
VPCSGLSDLLLWNLDRAANPPGGEGSEGNRHLRAGDRSSDDQSDHYGKAHEDSEWHSGASVRAADHSEPSAAEKQKTPARPGVSETLRGSSRERLRSESNRRWRICNPLP